MNVKFQVPSIGYLFPFLDTSILQNRLGWCIKLRWLAITGYFLATLGAKFIFAFEIPYSKIWLTLLFLLGFNFVYVIIQNQIRDLSFIIELTLLSIQIIIDLFFLSLLLHFSGGMENPIYFFYLFHVVLSSIVFPKHWPYLFSTLVVGLFFLLIYSEYTGILPHYSLFHTQSYSSKAAIELTLTVFIITVYVTTYISLTFMQIYRRSKKVIDAQNQKLIQASEQKLNFFRFASHELKSPIIAIKSSIDSVLATFGSQMDQMAKNLLQHSSLRAEQMLDIIKKLLELSKSREVIDHSKMGLIEPLQILEQVVAQEAVLAESKNISIEFEAHISNVKMRIQKEDLEKMLRNLINNAVRYTPENRKIWVKAFMQSNYIIFQVKDEGIGIPEEDLPKIFDEFFRSQNAKKMVNFGTGLGLSLVKQIIVRYNGKISVYSKVNNGATFVVKFPINEHEKKLLNGDV